MPNEVYSAREKQILKPPVEVPPHGTIEKQPSSGSVVPMPEMLSTYYEKRGWTPEGVPSDDRLRDLGLEWTKAKM